MKDDEHVLMRPVLRGVFRMESLLDGTLALEEVYLANDALDVFDENERRMHRAIEAQSKR
jgi:hypothetical protein